jgi:hypothetical protein
MALPNFDEAKELLARARRPDQSWGNLLREISSGTFESKDDGEQVSKLFTSKISLFHVLGEWDFYSSKFLDEAASDYGVKSWQVTEYVEGLREALLISESDLIVYETHDSTIPSQSDRSTEQVTPANSTSQPQSINVRGQNDDRLIVNVGSEAATDSYKQDIKTQSSSRLVLVLTGLLSALLVIIVLLIANQRNPPNAPSLSNTGPADRSDSETSPTKPTNAEVYLTGINLPITNSLCNKKRSFCIYNLATLINKETGEANYTFSDLANGEQVTINGAITVSNIERNGDNRIFTFAFKDDQSNTTLGWAAAGYFNLEQDSNPSNPGILTKFKTTESFGPKTPVGLENTSYLFPN